MRNQLAARFRSRPISSAVWVLCGLALFWLAAWQTVAWSQWSAFAVQSWAISAVGNAQLSGSPALAERIGRLAGEPVATVMPYRYRGRAYAVRTEVPAAELWLSRSLPTENVFASRGPLRAAYLRTMVAAAQYDPVVSATCVQLRQTRDLLGLGADEYAELLARFVQQIPYGPIRPRFGAPAATMADGKAVCADKSVLLAALLKHEGYDAAIVAIDANNHAAVAVRGTSSGFLHSGYAFVETTSDCYIGEVPPASEGAGPAGARTQVVSIGGGRSYGFDLQAQFVGETLRGPRRAATILKPYQDAYAQLDPRDAEPSLAALTGPRPAARQQADTSGLAVDSPLRTYQLLTRSAGR